MIKFIYSFFQKFCLTIFLISSVEKVKVEKSLEITLPLYMWHNRFTYDKEFIDDFNEFPIGVGFGLNINKKSKSVSINSSIFLDSYYNVQLYWGIYIRKYFQFMNIKDWYWNIGLTYGFTQRKNLFNYAPVLVPPYPIFGISYCRKISLEFTYLLGKKNFSNVFICWIRYIFPSNE